MTWLWLALAGWLSTAVVSALLIGAGLRLADRRDEFRRFRADSQPLSPPRAELRLVSVSGANRES